MTLISQFADDTNLFLSFDTSTLNAVVETLDIIHTDIGLKVNYDKTKLCRIGSLANTDAKLYTTRNFTWTKEPIEILGITVGYDIAQVTEINYTKLLIK